MKRGGNAGLSSWLLAIIYFGVAAIVIAVPLLSSWTLQTTCIYSKTTFFQIVVEILLAAWIPLALASPKFRPSKNLLTVAVLALAVVALIALPFSLDPHLSFWSKPTRMTGVVNLLHMVGWFAVLSSVLREQKNWCTLFLLSVTVSSLVGIIAFVQAFLGVNPVMATMCNQSFLAAYMLPHLGLTLFLLLGKSRPVIRNLLTIAAAFQLAAIYLSAARAGMLSALILLAGYFIVRIVVSGLRTPKKAVLIAAICLVCASIVGAVVGLKYLRSSQGANPSLPRPVQRLVVKDFGSDRLMLWNYAWRGFLERPIFGWGNEQFSTLYNNYFDPQGPEKAIFFERWQDRAHNQYLDTLVSYGIVGLLSLLFVWGAAFYRIKKKKVLSKPESAFIAALLGVLAFFSFLMFDTPVAMITLFVLFAFLASAKKPEPKNDSVRGWVLVLLLTVPLAAAAIWFVNMEPALRLKAFSRAEEKILSDGPGAEEQFATALGGLAPYRNEFRLNHLYAVQPLADHAAIRASFMEALVRQSVELTAKMAAEKSYDYKSLLAHAVANRLLSAFDAGAIDVAEEYAQRSLDVAPGRFDAYFEMGEINLVQGKFNQANDNFRRSADYSYDKLTGFAELVAFRLAQVEVHRGNYAQALELLALSADGPQAYQTTKDARLIIALGGSVQAGDAAGRFADYVNVTLKNFVVHPELHAAAARYFAAMGDKNRAAQIVGGMVRTTPDLARQLVEELDLPYKE